ncbi:MAG: helix-turn-helix domain-containing protein [Bacteroidota bacterium]
MDTKLILTTPDELVNLIISSVKKVINSQEINNHPLPDIPSEILSVDEAADFLNLARQTLYGFTSRREIPFMKKGKKLYFKRSELESWLLEGKRKTIKEMQNEHPRR